jgi:DNA-binding transcriptional LysR family regulator
MTKRCSTVEYQPRFPQRLECAPEGGQIVLMKTCKKLGLSFWHYLVDKLGIDEKVVPQLAGIVAAKACALNTSIFAPLPCAALEGSGVMLQPLELVQDSPRDGRLIELLPGSRCRPGLYTYYTRRPAA